MQDNSGARERSIALLPRDSRRSKHIELQYHHVRKKMRGKIHVEKIDMCEVATENLTKATGKEETVKANM